MKHDDPAVAFYRTGIHTVLKRYTFTPDEKATIQAAILTAKKSEPNMQLIAQADAVLKSVTSSQQPKEETLDQDEIARADAKIRLTKYPEEKRGLRKPLDELTLNILNIILVVGGMIVAHYIMSG